MALNIKSAEADHLARRLAAETGETITEAVTHALAERLYRVEHRSSSARRLSLRLIRDRVSALPSLDDRRDEELLGYDEHGTFG